MTVANIATRAGLPGGPSMIDLALAAAAVVSMAVAAMFIATDRNAIRRHVGDQGGDHDAAPQS